MLDSDFAAETRAMLANELRLNKLRELMRREYSEVHRQEMQRQRPAITLWDEYRAECVSYTNHDWDADQRIDGRREL